MLHPDFHRFNAAFKYDPENGKLFNRKSRQGKVFKGWEAGCIDPNGYVKIKFERKQYYAHRIIWLLIYGDWPTRMIDHRNEVRSDNRAINLRDVPRGINLKTIHRDTFEYLPNKITPMYEQYPA